MRLLLMLAMLIATVVLPAGCGDGVALSAAERANMRRQIAENDRKQLNDDWDRFWLNDRPSRLSRWTIE